MLTLHDLENQAIIYNEFVVTFRIWTRPTCRQQSVAIYLLRNEEGGGGPLYGLYEYVPRDSIDRFWSS